MGFIRGSSYYTIVDGPTWTKAEANAISLGGHLASINSADENEYLLAEFSQAAKYMVHPHGDATNVFSHWIGLTDLQQEGVWVWSSGETLTYKSPLWGVQEGEIRTDENYARVTWNVPIGWTRDIDTRGFWQDTNEIAYGTTPTGIAEIPLSYFSVSDLTLEEGESGRVTISRTGGTESTQTLILQSSNGTAVVGDDYSRKNQTITFAAGETSKSVLIRTLEDTTTEGTETFNLTLSVSGADAVPAQLADGVAVVTITDDDAVLRSILSIAHSTTTEGDDAAILITRTGETSNAVTLALNSQDGSAKRGADYTEVKNQSLTFAAGETSKTVFIATKEDAATESTEYFSLSISSSDPLVQFTTSSATVTILDDDVQGHVVGTGASGGSGTGPSIQPPQQNQESKATTKGSVDDVADTAPDISGNEKADKKNELNRNEDIVKETASESDKGNRVKPQKIKPVSLKRIDPLTRSAIVEASANRKARSVVILDDMVTAKDKASADIITGFRGKSAIAAINEDLINGSKIFYASPKSKKSLGREMRRKSNLIYNRKSGELLHDSNGKRKGLGSDGGVLAVFTQKPKLTASNFVLISSDILA